MKASRRGILGGAAALAAPTLPAIAVGAVSPDAALIHACNRYLEIERAWADPNSPTRHIDCDATPEWAEYEAVQGYIRAATPKTPEGWAAMARVALLEDSGENTSIWDTSTGTRLAHKLLVHYAGQEADAEAWRLKAEQTRRHNEYLAQRMAGDA
ncbi:hypothetical protein [Roseomonas populi]|uniref:Twin-arginine translocation pathway signal protein n=1 Tax=Roseomonas populi TaxID=3121582 RepID=A0ABT1WXS6_9PROT|nr:hypothetical protein [Roseomonas pecuniae]MCR0980624.1 hypothetical protein [Roseomonas pecuniae]